MHFPFSDDVLSFSETLNFLEEAANLVDHIVIVSFGYEMKKEKSLPLTLVQNILSKKCSYLNISDTTTKITLAEAEELVKVSKEKSDIYVIVVEDLDCRTVEEHLY